LQTANLKTAKENMNSKFDELTKQMAQSVTRRRALKKFSLGVAGMALACLGLAHKAGADPKPGSCLPNGYPCKINSDCCSRNCVKPKGKSGFNVSVCWQ
jgi:hypothetical protein